jgi:hypothetical protein
MDYSAFLLSRIVDPYSLVISFFFFSDLPILSLDCVRGRTFLGGGQMWQCRGTSLLTLSVATYLIRSHFAASHQHQPSLSLP